MLDIIGGVTAVIIGLLLSNLESIGDREIKIITILGWSIALFFAKGGVCND